MKLGRGLVLVAWTAFVVLLTGVALVFFNYGPCGADGLCFGTTSRNGLLILAIAFVVYWTVFLALVRRWNRDV